MSKIVLTAQLICQERVSCLNVIGAAQIVEESERYDSMDGDSKRRGV